MPWETHPEQVSAHPTTPDTGVHTPATDTPQCVNTNRDFENRNRKIRVCTAQEISNCQRDVAYAAVV